MNSQESKSGSGETGRLGEAGPQNISARVEKPLAGADFITAILLIIFGAVFYMGARSMKVYQMFFVSPGFFPMILGVLFVLFGVTLLYTSYLRGGWRDARRIVSGGNLKMCAASPVFKKWCVVFLLILVYVALLGKVSFVYLSMGYLFFTFIFLKAAKWYWIILISVTAPLAVQLVFVNFFRIPMP